MHKADQLGSVLESMYDEPTGARSRRRHDRSRRRHHRRRTGRRALVLLIALLVVGGGAYGAATVLRPWVSSLGQSQDYTGSGTGTVKVVITPGASGRSIARALEQAGVIKSDQAFLDAASAEPRSTSIQAGTYTLRSHMSGAAALTMMLDPSSRTGQRVLIREGLRVSEILPLLAKASGLPLSDYTAAVKNPADIGLPDAAGGRVEGWLFPDTYEFDTNSSAVQQLSQMVKQTGKVFDGLGVAQDRIESVLVEASVIQAEGSSPADFAKIARVLDNRLQRGMKLQLDSTVSYAVGKRTVTTTAQERATNSPYNTYRVKGLPAGAISNPGRQAIEAALHPADGPWLYFVAVNPSTGETKFATTAAEHDQNVAQFRQWCQANPGQC
jgi:UPF0755 protein